jgi:RimJ/RimL family protein N-acetyltransferase
MPTLSGEMVTLRPIRATDADGLWDMVTDEEGNRQTGTTRRFTREEIENLRLALRPGQRGRGFGGEAIQLVLDHAFADPGEGGLGLHRVSLDVLSINPRAYALYESLGFVVEGRLREAHLDGQHFCDVVVMAVLEDDWRARER